MMMEIFYYVMNNLGWWLLAFPFFALGIVLLNLFYKEWKRKNVKVVDYTSIIWLVLLTFWIGFSIVT